MLGYPIIVIGASAGGVEALVELVKRLPSDLPAAVLIAIHFPASGVSLLPQILSRLKTLPAHHAIDGEPIHPGQIYIAPPDHHLLLNADADQVLLSRGPRENGHRPAVDTLFRSAAYAYGERVLGVVLTGTLDDGTAGLLTIKTLGGRAIVQNPEEALFDGMPRSAIKSVEVDWVLTIAEIARLLIELSAKPPAPSLDPSASPMSDSSELIFDESEQVSRNKASLERGEKLSKTAASPITCPDCGGVLWELHEEALVRFRCHVGHAYSIDSLVEEQSQDAEKSLWTAVRALEEKAALARRMAAHAREQNRAKSAKQFEERAKESDQHANVIRQLILDQLDRQAENKENQKN